MALPHGAVDWSAVCGCVFPDCNHLLFSSKTVDLPVPPLLDNAIRNKIS